MKTVGIILFIVFLAFAVAQYSDPNAFFWFIAYAYASVLFLLRGFGRILPQFVYFGLIAYVLGMLLYIPGFISWLNMGRPSILATGDVKIAEIEAVRDLIGLALCALAMIFLHLSNKLIKDH